MKRISQRAVMVSALLLALAIAGLVSFYASASPDGLNKVAGEVGFADTETEHASSGSPLAGYETSGLDSARASRAVAGVTGCVAVLAITGGLVWVTRRRATDGASDEGSTERESVGSSHG